MNDIRRRVFANPTDNGAFAVPSLANPVEVASGAEPLRQDFGPTVGDAVEIYGDYWGKVWSVMTGSRETVSPDIPKEEQAKVEQAERGNPLYLLVFVGIIFGLFYYKKGA